jgi:TonB family protein
MSAGTMSFHDSDQRFRQIAWGCVLFYAAVALVINLIKVEKPEREDFTQYSPRIASLLIQPQTKPEPLEIPKPLEEAPSDSAGTAPKESDAKESPAKKPELTPEQVAKRNRQVAMKSGLLKLLSKKPASALNTERLVKDSSTLKGASSRDHTSALFGSVGGSSGAEVGSGGIDQLIGELGGKVEGINLGEKKVAAVENPLQLKDTEGKPVGRAYESIATVVDGLKGWIRFIYNKALRDDPSLKGVVTLEFTITKEGDVTNVSVASTTLNYPPIEDALVKRFKLLKFPATPKGGSVTVVYPITFSPLG